MRSYFGRYQVLQPLGQGAMAAVYLARDSVLSRLVAVKVLHSDLLYQKGALERFFKEAKTVSRINCSNVVNVFDFGMEGNVPYLVMEFIDGQTLQKVMYQLDGEPMDAVVASAMIVQVVDGLSAAAEWGVTHRDLKPDNLMLTQKGIVKVTDFGICHLKDHTMTATGQILGSPRFMSPEQVQGLKPLSVQSDLFSLGAVFYYLLAGVPPFMADAIPDLYRQIVTEPHRSLSEVRPNLDRTLVRLVDMLLEKDPAKRGDGPTSISGLLRKFLLKKKVAAPTERISAYIRELNAAGIQTSSGLKPEQIQKWMGSLDLGKKPSRFQWKRRKLSWAIAVLMLGVSAGVASFLISKNNQAEKQATTPPKSPVPEQSREVSQERPHVLPPSSDTIMAHIPRTEIKPIGLVEKSSLAITNSISETSKPESRDTMALNGSALITVQSAPPFAEVFLDGYSLGRTPLEGKECPSGKHRLILKSGYGTNVDTLLTLKPGAQTFKFTIMENPEGSPEP